LVFANSSHAMDTATSVAHEIGHSACAPQAFELLRKWKSQAQWVRRTVPLENSGGEKSFATPTDQIGTWIELSVAESSELQMRRRSPAAVITVRWNQSTCVPALGIKPYPAQTSPTVFTDQMLQTALNKNAAGMIYAWSPHMPLSVQGYPEAEKLAKKLGLAFVPVLDPEADLPAARSFSQAQHFDNGLKRNASIELLERGMNLHYPSIVLFSKGEIKGGMLPGYWDEEASLQAYVQEVLKK
jgi:hypothetical protein